MTPHGQSDYGDLILPERDLIADVVEATVRRTVNGRLDRLSRQQQQMNHTLAQVRNDLKEIADRSARWDRAADFTERLRRIGQLSAQLLLDRRILLLAAIAAGVGNLVAR